MQTITSKVALNNDLNKALFVVLLMIASLFTVVVMLHAPVASSSPNQTVTATPAVIEPVRLPASITGVYSGAFDSQTAVNPNTQVSIMVALEYQNQAQLNQYLSNVQNPASPVYHHYLTPAQFTNTYSAPASVYNGLAQFFAKQGVTVNKYADRVAINVVGTMGQMQSIFHTQIMNYRVGKESFYAPAKGLSLATPYAQYISTVQGLNNKWHAQISPLFSGTGSSQTLYGTDMQVAYQLNQLYPTGYPTNLTIATILWAGTDSSGAAVGPYYPSDISNYFSQVIPAGEPTPNVYGYPVGGAAAPGISSTKDTSQANYESTLDLEMAGSMAPGASIVEVYGPSATTTYLDQCFAAVLNPSGTTAAATALKNTVTISNSWGGTDSADSLWTQYEQQAASQGMSVFASSGDTGTSSAASFPASSAYNTYGTIGVGGTTTVLSGTASTDGTGTTGISSQTVWYNTPSSGDGSQAGVSTIYAEPSWQSGSSDANGVITAVRSGRGTPDIAAVGANMEIYITSSSGTGAMTTLWGTSVASPLVAGMVAEMDNYMGTNEGFFAPTIYTLGQNQYNGQYTSSTNPFNDVTTGANGVYSAQAGYDLPTGWGSINALNFINAQTGTSTPTYNVTFTESGLTSGTSWSVTLAGSTKTSTTSTITFNEAAGTYSYTVNGVSGYSSSPSSGSVTVSSANVNTAITFTAVPTYSVTFTESGLSSGTSWSATLGGSTQSSTTSTITFTEVAGTYSYSIGAVSGYTASPSSGSVTVSSANVNTAITFSVVTQTSGIYAQVSATSISTYSLNEAEQFNIGSTAENVNFVTVYLAGSGSATVSIGSSLWGTDVLAPQTVTIGSAGYYNVTFPAVALAASTSYYLNVESASGSPTWGYTQSATVNVGATQDYWYSGSTLYNDNSYPNIFAVGYQAPAAPTYSASFTESGLPSGTSWSMTLAGVSTSSTTSTISFSKQDGTYSYTTGSVAGYTVSPASGSITVNGANVNTAITYTAIPTYTVTFTESGLTSGTSWSATLAGTTKSSTTSTISFTEQDGTYSYSIGSVSGYTVSPSSGSVTVSGANVNTAITYTAVPTYSVTFTESGLTSGTSWSATLGGSTLSSTTSTITFTEVAGTYSYSIGSVSGYTASPASGSVTVSSANVNTAITFTQNTYTLSFTESGLPSGTSWSVTAGGSTQSSTTSTISFTEVAGSYAYTVAAVSGYSASPASGTATVSTANVNVPVTFTSTATPTVTAYSYVASSSWSYYTLPEAEAFNVGSTAHKVNFISVLLSGSGSVTVSIGSTLWGTDIVPAQTISVTSSQTNYTVSFSSATLAASTTYYLNVQSVSGSVQLGYTTSPTAAVGATQDYWYSGSTLINDNTYPNAYSVGYNTAGPAVITAVHTSQNTPVQGVAVISETVFKVKGLI